VNFGLKYQVSGSSSAPTACLEHICRRDQCRIRFILWPKYKALHFWLPNKEQQGAQGSSQWHVQPLLQTARARRAVPAAPGESPRCSVVPTGFGHGQPCTETAWHNSNKVCFLPAASLDPLSLCATVLRAQSIPIPSLPLSARSRDLLGVPGMLCGSSGCSGGSPWWTRRTKG